MIAWSIQAARDSGCFDQIIVSTDDTEIADVARHFGADVPFMRPANLSGDFVGTNPVVEQAIDWYQDRGMRYENICCLYATAPFVQPFDIQKGLELLEDVVFERYVFTATMYSSPIQRALRLDSVSGAARMWRPEQFSKRSQDLEPAYHDAGQFYWGRPQAWCESTNLFEGSKPLLLPRWRVQDIDSEDDWIQAELMFQALRQSDRNP